VSEGAWLTPETLLTTLQDTSRIKVDFSLPERYAGAVSIGQGFTFRVAGRGEDFAGSVIAVEPGIDAATRSVRVRGLTENRRASCGRLRVGRGARAPTRNAVPARPSCLGDRPPSTCCGMAAELRRSRSAAHARRSRCAPISATALTSTLRLRRAQVEIARMAVR
jgi:hypothetical protein